MTAKSVLLCTQDLHPREHAPTCPSCYATVFKIISVQPVKHGETFQIFSRTFQGSKKIQDFPGCGNPG